MELTRAAGQIAGVCDSVAPEIRAVLFMDGEARGRLTAVQLREPSTDGLEATLTTKILHRDPEILGFATRTSPWKREILRPVGSWIAVVVTGVQGDAFLERRFNEQRWRNVSPWKVPTFAAETAKGLRLCLDGEPLPEVRRHVNTKSGGCSGWYVGAGGRAR